MTTQEAIMEIRAMLKTTNKMGAVFQGRPDIDRRKEAYVMAIQSLQNESAYEQIKWERDIAISQPEEIGLGLGEKTYKVKSAVETAKKIPKVVAIIENIQQNLSFANADLVNRGIEESIFGQIYSDLEVIKENLAGSD